MRTRLGAAMLLAAAFGGCAETIGDPYVAPGKFRFLRCPDIAARQDTAEARHTELLALMKRSGAGVGGGAVNTFVYGPDLNNVEATRRTAPSIPRKLLASPSPGWARSTDRLIPVKRYYRATAIDQNHRRPNLQTLKEARR